jgi:hypothetical protein
MMTLFFRSQEANAMKWTPLCLVAALSLPITSGHALTPQQEKQQEQMKICNAEATAKELRGADRKTFVKRCLVKPAEAPTTPAPGAAPSQPSAVPAPPVPTPQTVPPSPR